MNSTTPIPASQVARIKRRLWHGDHWGQLATKHSLSHAAIQAILYGRRHASIPWPDGSTGAMSLERRAELRARWNQTLHEVRSKMLLRSNRKRKR